MSHPYNKQPSLLVQLVAQYRTVLEADNPRTGLPNWLGQIIMGAVLLPFPLLAYTAWGAWLAGHAWSDMAPTGSIRHGLPVMRPIGEMILFTGIIGCVGLAMIILAIALRPKDGQSST